MNRQQALDIVLAAARQLADEAKTDRKAEITEALAALEAAQAPLTWLQASQLPVGTRVRFIKSHDIYPEAIVPKGALGTVVARRVRQASWL